MKKNSLKIIALLVIIVTLISNFTGCFYISKEDDSKKERTYVVLT